MVIVLNSTFQLYLLKEEEEEEEEGEMGSNGTSWADQWDNGPDPVTVSNESKKKNNALGKTKAVASTGVKKLKEGTSVGFQWIKTKYHKTTQKH